MLAEISMKPVLETIRVSLNVMKAFSYIQDPSGKRGGLTDR